MVLRLAGYSVSVAFNGLTALELGARERPRAAIIDIGMPDMSGHEVARRMRLEAWGRNAVLIALTGWGQEEDKQAARASGFNEHFTKPVDLDHLARLLASRLNRDAEIGGGSDVADPARA
jgi:two-component system CheB/CheR fusion protein